ncbi:hypothetical protein AJ79_08864 [Helicocarpus griseus UAMH5409]|uniref:Uncharacterized protein n=1 Tax=Helicocarpus griseus UAMH5409 TaxID=1447875 RepID=A0A2B7WNU3_9EURO|nr:hypothetical protein AJ79_08864 [Helicocarpus griseus UAMH5409]
MVATTVSAAPAPTQEVTQDVTQDVPSIELREDNGHANFIHLKDDAGMNRWRFAFAGASCDDFKNAMKKRLGVTRNFQCWETSKKGTWNFDVTEVEGPFGDFIVTGGVKDVTKQSCCDMGLPEWAIGRCKEASNGWGC